MAIEFQIKGDFPLDASLAATLRTTLGPNAQRFPPPTDSSVFCLADDDVSITAVEMPDEEHQSLLFFRVLNKGRVVEAEDTILRALDAVLKATLGPLRFFFASERLLLERVNDEVRVLRQSSPPESDFWTDAHLRRIEGPVVFVVRKPRSKRANR